MLFMVISLQSSRFVFWHFFFLYCSIKKLLSLSSLLALIQAHFGLNVLLEKLLRKKNVSDPLAKRSRFTLKTNQMFENTTISSRFRSVSKENSGREIAWLS